MYDYFYYKPLIHKFLADVKDKYKDNFVSVIIFGSIARGKGRKESNIDLLIILENASDVYYNRLKPFVDIELKLRELYDKKNYFKKRLSLLKKWLSFLGSKKTFLEDGTWYWDLKPDLKMGEEEYAGGKSIKGYVKNEKNKISC